MMEYQEVSEIIFYMIKRELNNASDQEVLKIARQVQEHNLKQIFPMTGKEQAENKKQSQCYL